MADLPAYTLVRSRRRRSIAIMVDPGRGVVVYAPHRIDERALAGVLEQRRAWIKKKLDQLAELATLPKLNFAGDRDDAARLINERVALYAEKLQLFPQKVAVRDQRRRWGSCSARTGAVNLNWRLVMAPLEVLDYVVVHELSHIKHPNHSPVFWAHVAQFVPDYKVRRKWLRENGGRLVL
jgi:predicted metal-dependent hydrolase